jgi:secreted trypsin-like serine protease
MRRRASALLITASLLLVAAQPATAIVYGDPDTPPEYGNVGAIVGIWEGTPWIGCSGTLIAEGVFLTAAHCLPPGDEPFSGVVGISFEQDLTDLEETDLLEITGYRRHPDFSQRRSNPYDIAVIYFVDTTDLVPAVVAGPDYLSDLTKEQLRDATITAVGYGAVRTTKVKGWQGITGNLERRKAIQGMLSLEPAWLTLSMNQATGNGGTCYGDSGGPHFHGDVIVSITLTGDSVCKATDKTYRLDTPWAQSFLADALD